MKTVPESVDDEFSRRYLLSGVHKGTGYQLVNQKGMAIAYENQINLRNNQWLRQYYEQQMTDDNTMT
jgi:hypothetical protein